MGKEEEILMSDFMGLKIVSMIGKDYVVNWSGTHMNFHLEKGKWYTESWPNADSWVPTWMGPDLDRMLGASECGCTRNTL